MAIINGRSKATRRSALPSKVRGVIGQSRAHRLGVSEQARAYNFRIGLHQAILLSRSAIPPENYESACHAIAKAAAPELARFARHPIDEEYLHLLLDVKPLDIDQEVSWISCRLHIQSDSLKKHVELRSKIDHDVITGDWKRAGVHLDQHEALLGKSLWSVALRIAILQESEGDEARKEYVKAIRLRTKKGLLPFFAMLAGQRAASSTSIGWYLDDASRRLSRTKPGDLSDYLHYKLLNVWPKTLDACGSVLRVEQNHHDIDQYETLIAFLQRAVDQKEDEKLAKAVSKSVRLLGSVQDHRILKIARSVGQQVEPISIRIHDMPFASFNRLEAVGCYRSLRANSNQFYDFVAASILRASPSSRYASRRAAAISSRSEKIISGLASSFSRRSHPLGVGNVSDVDWTRKFAHVFDGIEIGSSIRHLLSACFHPDLIKALWHMRMSALATSGDGFFDFLTEPNNAVYLSLVASLSETATINFCDVARGEGEPADKLNDDAKGLALALRSIFGKSSRSASALPIIDSLRSDVAKRIAALVMITQNAAQGEIEAASILAADEFVVWGVDPSALPISDIFDGVVWRDLRDSANKIELSNAMSVLPQKKQDERMRSYRRFVLEHFLAAKGVDRPSELRSVATDISVAHLVYFLSRGCTQAMLDMLPSMKGTREVLEERRAICGYLVTFDPQSAPEYEDEILSISRELAVLDGLETFDGSRVHVDLDALAQILKRDLAEGFLRYASLVDSNTEASENFDLVLKEILRRDIQARLLISMPVSEADELLISMIWRARERFLFNVPHGLDSYLSKRIRHGSIVGFIRSPGESEGLMAQRMDSGEYELAGSWAENVVDASQRNKLHHLLASFSRSIDDRLILLRDVLLHVRSEEKQRGMLDAKLSPPEYHLIRSVASKDRSLDGFVETILLSLRGLLGPSLLQVRDYIDHDVLRFVSAQFESLRSRAKEILLNADERAAFDTAAGRASVAMQAAVHSASLWFDPVDLKPHTFTIEEVVDIAVASVAAISHGFDPKVDVSKTATFGISEQALPTLMDILFAALGNVAEHANCEDSPQVSIKVEHDSAQHTFSLRIENNFVNLRTNEELEEHLTSLREELRETSQSYRARQDTNSGMHKIHSTVRATGEGKFDFGAKEGVFHIFVELPFTPDRIIEL